MSYGASASGVGITASAQQAGMAFGHLPLTTSAYTILAMAASTTEARRQHIFFQGEESDPRYSQISLSAGMNYDGGNLAGGIALVEYDSAYRARAHATGAVDGGIHVFAATRAADGAVALYRDGAPLTLSASSAVAEMPTGGGGAWVGGAAANNRGHAGPILLCAVVRGVLSSAEVWELSSAPWQLFRADPIRIYSLPTGAISINSITASNITQTGARITLGLTR